MIPRRTLGWSYGSSWNLVEDCECLELDDLCQSGGCNAYDRHVGREVCFITAIIAFKFSTRKWVDWHHDVLSSAYFSSSAVCVAASWACTMQLWLVDPCGRSYCCIATLHVDWVRSRSTCVVTPWFNPSILSSVWIYIYISIYTYAFLPPANYRASLWAIIVAWPSHESCKSTVILVSS